MRIGLKGNSNHNNKSDEDAVSTYITVLLALCSNMTLLLDFHEIVVGIEELEEERAESIIDLI